MFGMAIGASTIGWSIMLKALPGNSSLLDWPSSSSAAGSSIDVFLLGRAY
jgi:hypothetical protein